MRREDELEHAVSTDHAERLASLELTGATLARELAEPLSTARLALQSAAAELEKLDGPEVVKQDLQAALAACSRIGAMARCLRNLTRRPGKIKEVEVHVPLVAQQTFRLLEPSAKEARVKFQTGNLEALPTLRMRENELDQFFFVLVQNAVQAADGQMDRHLLITGSWDEDAVVLQFQDDCGGIDPAHLSRIFEPFFTTKPPGQGTGLGLWVARRIVDQRGGQVSVENRPGEGVTFTVTFPQAAPPTVGGRQVS